MADLADLAASSLRGHYDRVYRYLRRRTGDTDRAEELTQEVFAPATAFLARRPRTGSTLEPLLFTIARRRFVDELRRTGRLDQHATDELRVEVAGTAGPTGYGREIAQALRRALMRLPGSQRQILVWKLLEGRPFREIARRSGASEGACKMRFVRALRSLRTELEKEGVEP